MANKTREQGRAEELLKELENWRLQLARNFALRNPNLSGDELNRTVQLTIDRIVFLRMAEDRGLEPWEQLLHLCKQTNIYDHYMKLCYKADDKYNSGLFHFQKEISVSEIPDSITPHLILDDKVFKPILQNLYFAHGSPYELGDSMRLFHERALPNLSDNIKCGNSLIGHDYFDGRLVIDDADARRVNGFDWNREFAAAMDSGGFDCVIGNPPYIDSELMSIAYPNERKYCTSHYQAASGNWDIFCVFIEQALRLCRPDGIHSFIVPNKLTAAEYASEVRGIIEKNHLISFRDYSAVSVFPVAVYPVVYTVSKASYSTSAVVKTASVLYERMKDDNAGGAVVARKLEMPLATVMGAGTGQSPWTFSEDSGKLSLVRKLSTNFAKLGTVAQVRGAATVNEAYLLSPILVDKQKPGKGDITFVNSGTIDRYLNLWGIKDCRYLGQKYRWPVVPSNQLQCLPTTRLQQTHKPKIIVAGMTLRLECMGDITGGILAGKSTSVIFPTFDIRYLLAIMNSRLIDFYYRAIYGGNSLSGGYLRIGPPQLKELPIRVIDEANKGDKQLLHKVCERVDSIMSLQEQWAQSTSDLHKRTLENQIAAQDNNIDVIVYQIYGLTDAEIEILEGKSTRTDQSNDA